MHTPSLSRRVTFAGVAVLAVLVVALDVAIYLGVRSELEANLLEVLDTRLDIARGLADETDPDELADRLTALGVPASIATTDGRVIDADPAIPRFGSGGIPNTLPTPRVESTGMVGDVQVTVFATRAGIDAALRRLLFVELGATVAAMALAILLLRRSTAVALEPLDEVVATAVRTAEGSRGERLRPDDAGTELGRLAVSFDAMLDELEAAVRSATESDARSQRFLADAAHQLRTPIAGIRASVESLVREEDEEVRDRLLGNLVRETGRSARLLANLLTVARLDSEDARPRGPLEVGELCRAEADRTRDLAPHVTVRCEVPDDPVVVSGDAEALREAVANLLDNARRHARGEIELRLEPDGDEVRIWIGDDGPGLPPDRADEAFERFASLDGRGGSGLGLPIARGVARAHGGDVRHVAGRGFVVVLPADGQRPA